MSARYLTLCFGTLFAMLMVGPVAAQRKGKQRVRPVEAPIRPPSIQRYVTIAPEFPGNLAAYLLSHLRYPDEAREAYVEGKSEVLFRVREDGSTQVLGIRRSAGTAALDTEACRIIRHMPLWKPAIYNGRPVPYTMVQPVIFRIR